MGSKKKGRDKQSIDPHASEIHQDRDNSKAPGAN